ncbi:uncharacterized protein BDW47DRAFT_100344 [Aspergillus candidus]|uniref:Uncharacterized protein n=1 Tax=Aspergillus candidus TaxID=41067 RepID=A0A2I2FK45_ASPCN|nr:hypothetical protein BDW47DRAFT_100344 [Aspergillus candidus]PLB41007.1 hypothetical protein BDW47DRAFT_100344 [Aspergillus candidus]
MWRTRHGPGLRLPDRTQNLLVKVHIIIGNYEILRKISRLLTAVYSVILGPLWLAGFISG